jgi:hypothetical protein
MNKNYRYLDFRNEKLLLKASFQLIVVKLYSLLQSIPFIVNGSVQQKAVTCAGYSL